MLTVLEELRGAGCKVVSVADGFDLEGPFREVIAAVMAWVAQMEGFARGERVAAARVRVEAAGGNWGRPARASDELAERVREMKSRKKMTIRKIAIALKIPKSTVGVILSRKGAYDPARSASQKTARKKSGADVSK